MDEIRSRVEHRCGWYLSLAGVTHMPRCVCPPAFAATVVPEIALAVGVSRTYRMFPLSFGV